MSRTTWLDRITLSEFPIGTVDPVYPFADALHVGEFSVRIRGQIVPDSCDPTSPAIAANTFYQGPVALVFSHPVSALALDAGCFDAARSTRIILYGLNDYRIVRVDNSVDTAVYEHFSWDFGENVIKRVVIAPIGEEPAGFAVDNIDIGLRAEHRTADISGRVEIDNLIWGTRWAARTVTYSFLEADSRQPGYGDGPETFPSSAIRKTTMAPFSDGQKAMTRDALDLIDDVAGLVFREVNDKTGAPGMIRLARADIPAPADGFYPGHEAHMGDVRIDVSRPTGRAAPGSYDFYVVIHEMLHALGLKHPHDRGGSGVVLPAGRDSHEFSVMSYRSFPGQSVADVTNKPGSFPQTPMMNDIAALQHLYGPNWETRSGDSSYVFDPLKPRLFETIWDGGGEDTYDASAYSVGVSLDLRPGRWSVLAPSQLARLGQKDGDTVTARGSIFNALMYRGDERSLIENAIGGSGDDRLIGNQVRNDLTGGRGDDRLDGLARGDWLFGGPGADLMIGGTGNDWLWGGRGEDLLRGDSGDDRLFGGRDDDTLMGGTGRDRLDGGSGADRLLGGFDADSFVFRDVVDSPAGRGRDVIVDFVPGLDRIELAGMDADATHAGRQGWHFVGAAAFSGTAGELRHATTGRHGLIEGDSDGDGQADFQILLLHDPAITAADLVL
ncbi:MAG: protease [Paracoccaceae bacterium]|nr:MAG: protease [Paracoccaceae bacterium]